MRFLAEVEIFCCMALPLRGQERRCKLSQPSAPGGPLQTIQNIYALGLPFTTALWPAAHRLTYFDLEWPRCLLLLPAFFKAMATACFCGFPAFHFRLDV